MSRMESQSCGATTSMTSGGKGASLSRDYEQTSATRRGRVQAKQSRSPFAHLLTTALFALSSVTACEVPPWDDLRIDYTESADINFADTWITKTRPCRYSGGAGVL